MEGYGEACQRLPSSVQLQGLCKMARGNGGRLRPKHLYLGKVCLMMLTTGGMLADPA